jgi:hypothetical protein
MTLNPKSRSFLQPKRVRAQTAKTHFFLGFGKEFMLLCLRFFNWAETG